MRILTDSELEQIAIIANKYNCVIYTTPPWASGHKHYLEWGINHINYYIGYELLDNNQIDKIYDELSEI